MTEAEAARFKHRLNSRRYYVRHLEACRTKRREYYTAHREKWAGPNGYRVRRKVVQECRP